MTTRKKIALTAALAFLIGAVSLRCAQVALPTLIPSAQAAIGDVTSLGNGEAKAIELLASATAVNSPPSGASAGLAINSLSQFGLLPEEGALVIASTAGSGTMTATFRLWGRVPVGGGVWVPLGPGGDALKGVVNEGVAIGETGTDTIRHAEMVENLSMFDRLYLEITAIGGTSTAVTGWLVVERQ